MAGNGQPSGKELAGRWFEAVPPGQILPPDVHAARLARRLETRQGCFAASVRNERQGVEITRIGLPADKNGGLTKL